MDVRKIGAFISDLRKSKNYTQAEFAQLLSVSHQAVSKWERGESMPDIGLLPTTAKLLGVTVDELLNGERTPVPAPAQASAADLAATALEQPAEPAAENVQPGQHQQPVNAGHFTPPAPAPEQPERPMLPADMGNHAHPVHAGRPDHGGHRLTFDHVSGLAPFVSKDVLETVITKAEGDVNWGNINALAPFLGRPVLEKLVDKVIDGTIEPDKIMGIAPFLGHEALDRLVNHAEAGSMNWNTIAGLGPFLSRETLSRLVHRVADGSMVPENILGLAPFLQASDLSMLIEGRGVQGLRPEHLAGLAPFLPQALIEKLVLGYKPEADPE